MKPQNVVLIVTDQERAPTCYESDEAIRYLESLPGRAKLRNHGVQFQKHYTATCACTPSRATLYTGQFPSLHGLTQTYGGAKTPYDPKLIWLTPGTVPTIGDYFRQAGYDTKYIGKWHLSHEDITNDKGMSIPSVDNNKSPLPKVKERYLKENKLNKFGFDGWIGPEPHGAGKMNSGWNRDTDFITQFIQFIDEREASNNTKPFFVAINIVNPHDIVLFPWWLTWGLPTTDGTVPEIPPAPTANEDLRTKPSTQLSYHKQYNKLFFFNIYEEYYRQLYYYLLKVSDIEIERIYDRMASSKFFKDTAIVLTADHGELLGAHGGLRQKWYNAYQESINIPLTIFHPSIHSIKSVSSFTSSIDILPTILGLVGLNAEELRLKLEKTHTEAHPLPGKDLSPIIFSNLNEEKKLLNSLEQRPLVFQIEDNITEGDSQIFPSVKFQPSLLRIHHFEFDAVQGPTSIQAMIINSDLSVDGSGSKTYKLVRYWDNPDYWTEPGKKNVYVYREGLFKRGKTEERTEPLPEEFELYNLTDDPLEEKNLWKVEEYKDIFQSLRKELDHQVKIQCITPSNPSNRISNHIQTAHVGQMAPVNPLSNREPDSFRSAVAKIFGFPTLPRRVEPFSKL